MTADLRSDCHKIAMYVLKYSRGGLLVATPIGDRKVARSNPTSLKLRYQRSGLTTPTSFKPRFIRRVYLRGLSGSVPDHGTPMPQNPEERAPVSR